MGTTSGDSVIPDNNTINPQGGTYTNKTGVVSLSACRTTLTGGYGSTNYPLLMGVDWWGNYGGQNSGYGGGATTPVTA